MKLDGYRAIAFKSDGRAQLRSRNNNDFNRKYPAVAAALVGLSDETVVDDEVVPLDESGRPSFNALQNYAPASTPIVYYIFDVLVLAGRDLMSEPVARCRDLLRSQVLPKLKDPVRESPELNASLADVIRAVRAQSLEGVVAKNLNSRYEPGRGSGAWQKMRVNKGKEFVIGGYTAGSRSFDAGIFGYYEAGTFSTLAGLAMALLRFSGTNFTKSFMPSGVPNVRLRTFLNRDRGDGVWALQRKR